MTRQPHKALFPNNLRLLVFNLGARLIYTSHDSFLTSSAMAAPQWSANYSNDPRWELDKSWVSTSTRCSFLALTSTSKVVPHPNDRLMISCLQPVGSSLSRVTDNFFPYKQEHLAPDSKRAQKIDWP